MADEDYNEPVINDDPQEVVKTEAILTNLKQQINAAQFPSAMKLAATTFPSQLKNPQLKQQIVDTFALLFSNFAGNETFVNDLDHEQRTNLLSYAVKIMANGDKKQCDSALNFYALITKKDGCGVLNRVMICRRV